tara:strand:- start:782 stop:1564 length:783 start_codon:yes stop_codon:yes gene_type:complete
MDVNAIMNQYKDINQHIDDINKANKIDYDTKMGAAQGKEFMKSLVEKGKATQDIISGVSTTAKEINEKATEAAKAAKASKLAGGVGEGAELEMTTMSDLGKSAAAGGGEGASLVNAGEVSAEVAGDVGKFAKLTGGLAKGSAAFGVGMGLYDIGKNIVEDVQNKKVSISGNNWQEKFGTVSEEISGGLDAAGLALGPEFLLAGAVVGGVGEIMNIWGGEKDHQGVPEPPKPVVEQEKAAPNLAQLGMVQNHINNIKQFTN